MRVSDSLATVVIVPALDEGENIESLVAAIRLQPVECVLIFDTGS